MKKIKIKILILTLILTLSLMAGCMDNNNNANPPNNDNKTVDENNDGLEDSLEGGVDENGDNLEDGLDAITSASIVNTETGFKNAISENGTWIICTLTDLEFDEELVLDGEFTNNKQDDEGNDIIQRKIALYEQDENRNVTARYTLTAPKLTINSPNARIQGGTFVGDLYVSAPNFELVDAKVEGNVYFTTEEAESTFKIDDASSVTGTQELVK